MHMMEGRRYPKLYDSEFFLDNIACSDIYYLESVLDEYIIIMRTHWSILY